MEWNHIPLIQKQIQKQPTILPPANLATPLSLTLSLLAFEPIHPLRETPNSSASDSLITTAIFLSGRRIVSVMSSDPRRFASSRDSQQSQHCGNGARKVEGGSDGGSAKRESLNSNQPTSKLGEWDSWQWDSPRSSQA